MTTRVSCLRCDVEYVPELTSGTCPVCDAAPPGGGADGSRRRLWDDSDSRLFTIIAAATIGNVLLLGLLAVAVLH